jgi:hypothetical protein
MKFGEYAYSIVVPHTPELLGVRLQPLSIGMYLNLRAYGCNFVSEEPTNTVDLVDLIKGLIICGTPQAEEFPKFFADKPRFTKEVGEWSSRLTKVIKKDKEFNVFLYFTAFRKYLEDGCQLPEIEIIDKGGKKDNVTHYEESHWSSSLMTFGLAKLGLSYDKLLNLSLNELWYHYFQFLAFEGHCRFVKKPDERYQEYLSGIEQLKTKTNESNPPN